MMGQMTDMSRKAVFDPVYSFDIYLQVESSDEDDQQMIIDGYLSGDGTHTAVLFPGMGEKTIVIIDTKNQSLVILSDAEGQKSGFAMAIDPGALKELSAGLEDEFSGKPFAELKTGKSKEILGYECDEYMWKDENGETRIWASEALGKKLKPVLESNEAIFGGALVQAKGLGGMVLEFSYADNSGTVTQSMKIKRLDLNASFKISTGDYKVMSAGQ
jgi:hypothetical protein